MCWLQGRNELVLHLREQEDDLWVISSKGVPSFPFSQLLFSCSCTPESDSLPSRCKASLRAPVGLCGVFSILCSFSVQRPKPYTYVIFTGTIQFHLGVLPAAPWAGGRCRGWLQLHSGCIFPLLNDSEGRNCSCLTMANVLASSWTHVPNISTFSR